MAPWTKQVNEFLRAVRRAGLELDYTPGQNKIGVVASQGDVVSVLTNLGYKRIGRQFRKDNLDASLFRWNPRIMIVEFHGPRAGMMSEKGAETMKRVDPATKHFAAMKQHLSKVLDSLDVLFHYGVSDADPAIRKLEKQIEKDYRAVQALETYWKSHGPK